MKYKIFIKFYKNVIKQYLKKEISQFSKYNHLIIKVMFLNLSSKSSKPKRLN